MEIKLKGREIPRAANGDAHFVWLDEEHRSGKEGQPLDVLTVFTPEEVVELVNRALYQLEYQRESHRKRGAVQRARDKALRDELKKQGLDPKAERVKIELKGE